MAFDVAGAKAAGYSDTEIADHLAATSKFDAASARKAGYSDAEILQHLTTAAPADEPSFGQKALNVVRDLQFGALRGAAGIGSTLLAPTDALQDVVNGAPVGTTRGERKASIDEVMREHADPSSIAFGTGKLGTEVAGTSGAGGLIARGLSAIPGVAAAAPNALNAIRTAGMTAGQGGGTANSLLRVAGGAIAGGASAGLVDPGNIEAGALIGGALPGVAKVAGVAGRAAGRVIRGPEQTPELANAVMAARGAGYVIPPTQAKPSLGNRLLEGFSGKLTTGQNASARNAAVTNRLAATEIGLAPDTVITPAVLQNVRQQAGQAYAALDGAGTITPGPAYTQALDKITQQARTAAQGFPGAAPSPVIARIDALRSPQFDASAAVAQIRELRNAADTAFGGGDRGLGKSLRQGADALEDAIDAHLQQSGNTALLDQFRAGRMTIAKTYSIEKALNPTTGTVDARTLAAQLKKGKPLSGGLRDAADFGARFKTAAQTPENMGSLPQTSPLDWALGVSGALSTGNPLAMIGVASRPAARALALSPLVQNRLIQGQPNALALLADPGLAQLGYQAAPTALGGR